MASLMISGQCVRTGAMVRQRLAVVALFVAMLASMLGVPPATAQAVMSGTIFLDRDDSGAQDSGEPGLTGVLVTLYNAAGRSVGSDTSRAGGTFAIDPTEAGPYRVEFGNLPPGAHPSAHGADNGSSVLFVDTVQTITFGVVFPGDYCQANPRLASVCHLPGNAPQQQSPVVYTFPYAPPTETTPPTPETTEAQIGTTWGVSYQRSSDSLFTAAFMKRHAKFGPGGTGAIYRIVPSTPTTPGTTTLFVDLNALFGAGFTGTDGRPANVQYDADRAVFDLVGKISLGDIDISDDELSLWTINLANRELLNLPIGNPPVAPNAAQIRRVPLPITTIVNQISCPAESDIRPFALETYRDLVYVGMVCSAQSTNDRADLSAAVYAFDPVAATFTLVLNFPLNYPRRCVDVFPPNSGQCGPFFQGDWNPWVSTLVFDDRDDQGFVAYPQPWLTDLAFDNGNMILAFRDRFGDQSGFLAQGPTEVGPNYTGIVSGDVLRACGDQTRGWVIESNGSCGGITTAGANDQQGPDNGEYYLGDKHPNHDGIGVGGLAQIPGAGEVVMTSYDPLLASTFEGGVVWLNNTTGARERGYRVYGDNNTTQAGSRFAKSNGMGDIIALCDAAPVEIGNRVWFDANGNGVQDAGETSLSGVTVELVDDRGQVIQTARTNTDGQYYFSNDDRRSTTQDGSAVFGITGLRSGGTYSVRIPLNQPVLNTFYVTGQDTDTSSGGNNRDSDGNNAFAPAGSTVGNGQYTSVTFAVGGPGNNNHTYDFGFTISPTAVVLKQFLATRNGMVTRLTWETLAELETYGFHVYRSDSGRFEDARRLTGALIPAVGRGTGGAAYSWVDQGSAPAATTRYWLVEIERTGRQLRHGPAMVGPDPATFTNHIFMPFLGGT